MSDTKDPASSRTARIRELAKHDPVLATQELSAFLSDLFAIEPTGLTINADRYSLNSLNGFIDTTDGSFFFKFHHEEGDEKMSGKYCRADLIADAGLPIDLPVLSSTSQGGQIVVYKRRKDRRFSDVLRDLDETPDNKLEALAAAAERVLDTKVLKIAKQTLHDVTPQQVADEPIHRLFYKRMADPDTGVIPGGRYKSFYVDQVYIFPGVALTWDKLAEARLILNDQPMMKTIGEIFEDAAVRLNPNNLASAGGIVAHGDAHNANVWFEARAGLPRLCYFDPVFAGEHVPSLLAEVTATFHNIFAHPYWLYDPAVAEKRFNAKVSYQGGVLHIQTDWALNRVRQKLLTAKSTAFWKPFLAHLRAQNLLPDDWQDTIRSALAMSPALVMNLRNAAGSHNRISSAIGFYVIGLAGSRPVDGSNIITEFFDGIDPGK